MTWAMKTRDLLRQGREEGRKEGRKEGREEMRETGIKALVVTLKELSQTLDLVIQTVAEQFDLSLEEAEEKTKQYWCK
jgi:predicted transposase YdaD